MIIRLQAKERVSFSLHIFYTILSIALVVIISLKKDVVEDMNYRTSIRPLNAS
jgi:hypothetical protein